MGIVRRHPFLTLTLLVLLSPLAVLGTVVAAQQLPACREWRAEVEETTDARMRNRYLGNGNAQDFDRAYHHWDATYRETRDGVRAQVAHELSAERPGLCL